MRWKDYKNWFKGAINGIIISLIISIGLIYDVPILTKIASLGLYSCYFLTQCSVNNICEPCLIIALMLNMIYGFLAGAFIGYSIEYFIEKKNIKNKKVRRKK
ncbi:MAG: hypothetical protein QXW97_03540 [Candidatus Pacearchaeota archaeon]